MSYWEHEKVVSPSFDLKLPGISKGIPYALDFPREAIWEEGEMHLLGILGLGGTFPVPRWSAFALCP